MKVICTQENLKNGLLVVGRIISSSNTLPILNNILIKTENGLLKLSSTNLEIGITTHIRCKIEEEGSVTVMCKTITDLVNNLPSQNIHIETQAGQIKIETENYHTTVKTLPPEDFPLIPTVETGEILTLDAQELKKSLDQVGFAVSTNQTQAEISGVLLAVDKSVLRIAATDRYRLAEKKLVFKKPFGTERQVIVPHKTILEISRIIGSQKGDVEIGFSETQIAARFNDTEIVSRLIDGEYPPYQQIIPSEFNTQVVTLKQPFINALRASGIFSQATHSVRFEYEEGGQKLVLATESSELGKSDVELSSKVSGKSGAVMLNYNYVLDCLNSMDTEKVVLKIVDDSTASLITPEGQNDYLYLVMPIKG